MDCRFISENQYHEAYVLHRLDPEQRSGYEAHLDGCPTCSQALESERSLILGIRQVGHDEMKQEIQRQIATVGRPVARPKWSPWMRIAAVLLIFVAIPSLVYYAGIRIPFMGGQVTPDGPDGSEEQIAIPTQTRENQDSAGARATEELNPGKATRILPDTIPKVAANVIDSQDEIRTPRTGALQPIPLVTEIDVEPESEMSLVLAKGGAAAAGSERDSVRLRAEPQMRPAAEAASDPPHAPVQPFQPLKAAPRRARSYGFVTQGLNKSDQYRLDQTEVEKRTSVLTTLQFVSERRKITVSFSSPVLKEDSAQLPDSFSVTLRDRSEGDWQMHWTIPLAVFGRDWSQLWLEIVDQAGIVVYTKEQPLYTIDLEEAPLEAHRVQ